MFEMIHLYLSSHCSPTMQAYKENSALICGEQYILYNALHIFTVCCKLPEKKNARMNNALGYVSQKKKNNKPLYMTFLPLAALEQPVPVLARV